MTYVGAVPTTGDFKLLDSITTSSSTTFNLRQGGVAVYPQSANHCLVVLNGVLQTAGSSFNIVNDTIVFASSLGSSDVINQILVLGNVNDIGVPSDDTVSASKIQTDAVLQAKIADEAIDEARLQISNAGTNGQFLSKQSGNTGGLTWADAGGANTPAFEAYKAATANVSDDTYEKIPFDTEIFDVGGCYDHSTNYRFTPNVAGKYFVYLNCWMSTEANGNFEAMWATIYKNGSGYARNSISAYSSNALRDCSIAVTSTIVMNGSSDYVEAYSRIDDNNMSSNPRIVGGDYASKFGAFRIIE